MKPKKLNAEEKLLIAIYGSVRKAKAWQKAQREAKEGITVPPKPPKAKPIPETAIHLGIARLLALTLPAHVMWWHTPNGEARSARTGAKLKAMGTKPGVPDFLLYDTRSGYLYCLEVKTAKGRLSDNQEAWLADFQRSPTGRYAVARSVEEASTIVREWWPPVTRREALQTAFVGADDR